ncbi:unnamed protein product [Heterobilharzia americana]|nr:unnamed protein product [Heterobilharzia americana]
MIERLGALRTAFPTNCRHTSAADAYAHCILKIDQKVKKNKQGGTLALQRINQQRTYRSKNIQKKKVEMDWFGRTLRTRFGDIILQARPSSGTQMGNDELGVRV